MRRYLATVNDREAVSKVRQHLLAAGRDEDARSEVQAEDVGSGMMRELPLIVSVPPAQLLLGLQHQRVHHLEGGGFD